METRFLLVDTMQHIQDADIEGNIPETYLMLLTNVISILKNQIKLRKIKYKLIKVKTISTASRQNFYHMPGIVPSALYTFGPWNQSYRQFTEMESEAQYGSGACPPSQHSRAGDGIQSLTHLLKLFSLNRKKKSLRKIFCWYNQFHFQKKNNKWMVDLITENIILQFFCSPNKYGR